MSIKDMQVSFRMSFLFSSYDASFDYLVKLGMDKSENVSVRELVNSVFNTIIETKDESFLGD